MHYSYHLLPDAQIHLDKREPEWTPFCWKSAHVRLGNTSRVMVDIAAGTKKMWPSWRAGDRRHRPQFGWNVFHADCENQPWGTFLQEDLLCLLKASYSRFKDIFQPTDQVWQTLHLFMPNSHPLVHDHPKSPRHCHLPAVHRPTWPPGHLPTERPQHHTWQPDVGLWCRESEPGHCCCHLARNSCCDQMYMCICVYISIFSCVYDIHIYQKYMCVRISTNESPLKFLIQSNVDITYSFPCFMYCIFCK